MKNKYILRVIEFICIFWKANFFFQNKNAMNTGNSIRINKDANFRKESKRYAIKIISSLNACPMIN